MFAGLMASKLLLQELGRQSQAIQAAIYLFSSRHKMSNPTRNPTITANSSKL